jgi:SsrA-binding protein
VAPPVTHHQQIAFVIRSRFAMFSLMAKSKKPAKPAATDEPRIDVICRNRRATHEYHIVESLECGLVLTGTEVKSLRENRANLDDAFARIDDGEVWLYGTDIPEYAMAKQFNHKPKRPRKLLLHKREVAKFAGKASEKGFTLVPLRMYFKGGRAKVELAVARGKNLYDKRQALKNADAKKELRKVNRRG